MFATPAESTRLRGDSADDDDVFLDEDDEPSSGSVAIRVGGSRDYNDLYYDWQSGNKVSGQVRDAVDALVADDRFNGYRSGHVVAEYVAELDADEAEAVERVARRVFDEGVGNSSIIELPSWFSPLSRIRCTTRWPGAPRSAPSSMSASTNKPGSSSASNAPSRPTRTSPALVPRLNATWPNAPRPSSLGSHSQSATVLGSPRRMRPELQVLEPHLEGESGSRADRLVKEVARLEQERFGLSREERYATAARQLQAGGMRRAEVSRRLGISNSILERLVATHRRDVELASDDPIRIDLAPDL